MPTDAADACRDADGIIYPPLGMAGSHIADRTGVPSVLASLVPVSRTGEFPAVGGPDLHVGRTYNRLTYAIGDQMGWQPFRRLVNGWRVETLGVPPAPFLGPMRSIDHRRRPVLYGFSPSIVPRPPDWGPHIRVTGYWFSQPDDRWQPPPDLAHFLDSGPPPVYAGFGSMTDREPARVARIVLEALRRAECRAVVLSGWAGLAGVTDPPRVHFVDSVPHNWLFPKTAAVVHHWGAGTTHAGLLAGAPTVVVPFFTDQPFWGARVADLGVGPRPIPRSDLSVDRMAAALRRTTRDSGMRVRARVIGERIRAEDGVAQAVRALCDMWPVA